MIQIILVRSDNHLREVLRTYEGIHRHNFAKAMISKSRNLVVCQLQSSIKHCPNITVLMTPPSKKTGRDSRAYPQRRYQPTHAGCTASSPSDLRISSRERTRRALNLPPGPATLGAATPGGRQTRIPQAIQRKSRGGYCAGGYRHEQCQRVGRVLHRTSPEFGLPFGG
jgi:hypothetical protein